MESPDREAAASAAGDHVIRRRMMGTYLTKRIIYMIVILFAASFLIFSLYALTPGISSAATSS